MQFHRLEMQITIILAQQSKNSKKMWRCYVLDFVLHRLMISKCVLPDLVI